MKKGLLIFILGYGTWILVNIFITLLDIGDAGIDAHIGLIFTGFPLSLISLLFPSGSLTAIFVAGILGLSQWGAVIYIWKNRRHANEVGSRTGLIVLQVMGLIISTLSMVLAIRLVWEQTVWSWKSGPQMVGFQLMHSGLGPLLLIALWGGLVWVAVVLVMATKARSLGGRVNIILLIIYGLAWILVMTPYGFWQRMFIDRYSDAQAKEFFLYDAAMGDKKSVEKFLRRGVDINTQGNDGTALHGAAIEGELEMITFLLSHGADVNAINAYGDSPMAYTRDAKKNRNEAQALSAKHGGSIIRGSEEQRKRVIEEQVREMDNLTPHVN